MKRIIVLALTLFTINSYAVDNTGTGKTITTPKGDVISFSAIGSKPVHIANSNTTKTIAYGEEKPILLNGSTIYYVKDENDTVNNSRNWQQWIDAHIAAEKKLNNAIKKEKKQLPKGTYYYTMKNMVINAAGELVYYETDGIVRRRYTETTRQHPGRLIIPAKLEQNINEKLKATAGTLTYTPMIVGDKTTAYYNYYTLTFSVK
ncbi:MAG: hypothetical protein ACK4EY_02500 [Flavipsychrobacter sp.]